MDRARPSRACCPGPDRELLVGASASGLAHLPRRSVERPPRQDLLLTLVTCGALGTGVGARRMESAEQEQRPLPLNLVGEDRGASTPLPVRLYFAKNCCT